MTVLKWLLIVVSVGYVCGLAALFLLQRSVLFPIPHGRAHGAAGRRLSGSRRACADHGGWREGHRLARAGEARAIRSSLYFHGNGDFLAGFFGRFRDIIADGTGIVALSYRGYAGSSGQPSEQGLLQDAAAAYAFTAARYSADKIVVWGFSLGTGVAVALAAEQPVGKLILEAPYTSIADVAASAFPIFPVRLVMRDPFHSDQRIARVKVPLLVMHGAPRSRRSRSPSANACLRWRNEPKQFVRFARGGHNDLDDFGAMETARQFIGAAKG